MALLFEELDEPFADRLAVYGPVPSCNEKRGSRSDDRLPRSPSKRIRDLGTSERGFAARARSHQS